MTTRIEVRSPRELINVVEEILERTFNTFKKFEQSINFKKLTLVEEDKEYIDTITKDSCRLLAQYVKMPKLIIEHAIPYIDEETKIIAESAPSILALYTLISRMESSDNKPNLLFGPFKKLPSAGAVILEARNVSIPELHPFLQLNLEYLPEWVELEKNETFTVLHTPQFQHQQIAQEIKQLKKFF